MIPSGALWHFPSFILLLLSAFAVCSLAAPVNASYSDALYTRAPCPSLETMREGIRPFITNDGSNMVFYTTRANEDDAYTFSIRDMTPHGNTWKSVVKEHLYDSYRAACGGEVAEVRKVVNRLSTILAQEAAGRVWLLSRGTVDPTRVWGTYEFPRIQRNHNVDEVYQYDLDTGEITKIWTRGQQTTLLPLVEP